jgi:hypothetical protein
MQSWIYHKTKEPIVVDDRDIPKHVKEGWAESPAAFINIKDDFKVDPDDAIAVQQLGENIEGIKDFMNDTLNLPKMTVTELEEFAMTNFGINVNKSGLRKKKRLVKEVEALINRVSD